ncbi:MAG: hypothetical protein JZU65_11650, partial [Chlorobium sp.]|nr:hypothetical protein [Chlorobium sp.]
KSVSSLTRPRSTLCGFIEKELLHFLPNTGFHVLSPDLLSLHLAGNQEISGPYSQENRPLARWL